MRDWKSIALAMGLTPSPETERAAETVRALDEVFAPMIRDLPPELEPCTTLHFPEEGE